MKLASILFVAAASSIAGTATAAPHARAAWPSVKASEVKSWVLNAWGPKEPLSTKGDLVLLDANLQSKGTIEAQKKQGKIVVCYISAGSIENWRKDYGKASGTVAQGKKYKGWESTERWVNVLEWETAKPIMSSRLSEAANKGCDAVELDNLDCYDHGSECVPGASTSELKKKSVEYIKWLSQTAHSKGLAVGLKNVNGIVDQVASYGDFAIEEANPASEFKKFKKFINANKAVLSVQYRGGMCGEARKNGLVQKYQSQGWHNC